MKDPISISILIVMGLFAVFTCFSLAMTISWTARFTLVRKKVIEELKPTHPTIEDKLQMWSYEGAGPLFLPLLKSLTEYHPISQHLQAATKAELENTIGQMSSWRKTLFKCCGLLAVTLPLAFLAIVRLLVSR